MADAQAALWAEGPGSSERVLSLPGARARLAAVRPSEYARTRNALNGAVTGLSPDITHGLLSLREVLAGVVARHPLDVQHKLVYELGWRAYYRHVWQHRGEGILQSLHDGPLPDEAYARELPEDIRQARTGVPVVDQAVRALYTTGLLHNHARMWLASYVVHLRRVHWRSAADWLYGHLLDGDLASNHLSWQWVAGTGSHKPYLFNAENVARFAPPAWHSRGTVVDSSYELLDHLVRRAAPPPVLPPQGPHAGQGLAEPPLLAEPPEELGWQATDAAQVQGREVWLVHPWNLGELPAELPEGTLVLGLSVAEFHRRFPWSERRWRVVNQRMAELAPLRWWGPAEALGAVLKAARSVRGVAEPHLADWLPAWAQLQPPPALFPEVGQRCDSFSKWWTRSTRGLATAAELLQASAAQPLPASAAAEPLPATPEA